MYIDLPGVALFGEIAGWESPSFCNAGAEAWWRGFPY
jgi:hypothetical protein